MTAAQGRVPVCCERPERADDYKRSELERGQGMTRIRRLMVCLVFALVLASFAFGGAGAAMGKTPTTGICEKGGSCECRPEGKCYETHCREKVAEARKAAKDAYEERKEAAKAKYEEAKAQDKGNPGKLKKAKERYEVALEKDKAKYEAKRNKLKVAEEECEKPAKNR